MCPYGSLRSPGRSLRSLPVQTVHSLPLPIPPQIHIPPLGRPGRRPIRAVREPGGPARRAGARNFGRGLLRGPPRTGSLVDPVRDSLGGLGGGQKTPIFSQFLANLGPIWAHNPANRGHGWLPLAFLCISGTTNVHFELKNPIFRAFSMDF